MNITFTPPGLCRRSPTGWRFLTKLNAFFCSAHESLVFPLFYIWYWKILYIFFFLFFCLTSVAVWVLIYFGVTTLSPVIFSLCQHYSEKTAATIRQCWNTEPYLVTESFNSCIIATFVLLSNEAKLDTVQSTRWCL